MNSFFSLKTFLRAGLLVLFSFLFAIFSFAATIGLFPVNGTFNAGDTFSVGVSVSSPDQPMNAVNGTISYPADLLEVSSISRGGSIVQIWVREPSFSNATGTIQFEGVILNPGFQGASGNILTINFRAKSAGSAPVSFLSGSVLANDGKGTGILSGLGSANFTIVGTEPPAITPEIPDETETQEPVPTLSTPVAPVISSQTHPDQTKWYANNEAVISWGLPESITAINYVIDQEPFTIPPPSSTEVTSSTQEELADGLWYIHIRFRNRDGWGETAHFALRIDTQAPENFQAILQERDDLSNPRVQLELTAEDKVSGVEYYRLVMDDQDTVEWKSNKTNSLYETPSLRAGDISGTLQVVDFAGNIAEQKIEFTIKPIDAPEIIDYHEELESGESFYIEAKTIPNSTVFIWVEEAGSTSIRWITRSDRNGNIRFISDQGLRAGAFNAWLQVQDQRGALSESSEVISITIAPTGFTEFWQSNFRLLVWLLGIAWILFIIIIWYLLARLLAFKHTVRDDANNALVGIHRAFNLLRDDVHQEINAIDKKSTVSVKERKTIDQIQKDLDTVEEYVEQKINQIDDKVNQTQKKKKKTKKQAKSKKQNKSKKK